MITEKLAKTFLDLKESIGKYDSFLEPFIVNPNPREQTAFGYPAFFRKSMKKFGYFKDGGYAREDRDVYLDFDESLKKYIGEAVAKRRQELVQELDKLTNS